MGNMLVSYRGSLPDNVPNTLKSITFSGFQTIKVALRIIGTMLVTSCECERSLMWKIIFCFEKAKNLHS